MIDFKLLLARILSQLFWITGKLENQVDIIDIFYPIGSIYETIKNQSEFDPNVSWGGTWELIQGRFLIGSGTGTDKNGSSQSFTLGATSGEYQHTLTIAEMPSHTHVQNPHKHSIKGKAGSPSGSAHITGDTNGTARDWCFEATATNKNTGDGEAHPILPPYEVVNIWKRTA